MSASTESHKHRWQIISGWTGRYRCAEKTCAAIGYRGVVTADTKYNPIIGGILAYKCGKKGCGGPACEVNTRNNKQNRCRVHA